MRVFAYLISTILLVMAAIHVMGERPIVGVPVFVIPALFGIFYGMGFRRSNNTLIFMVGYVILFGMYFAFGIRYNLESMFTWEAMGYIILSIWMGILYFSNRREANQ